jgi:hypothetical protein
MSFGIAVWLAFYVAIAFLLGRLYASFVGWKFVRVAFFPGVAAAALARSLACLLTGNDAKQCDTWRQAGPVESKGAPPGSTGFRLFFAVAPFLLALVGVLLADWILDHPVKFDATLPSISTTPSKAGETFFGTATDFTIGIWHGVAGQKLGDAGLWLYLYIAAALIIAAAPTTDDLKAVFVACGTIALTTMVSEFLGVSLVVNDLQGGPVWHGFSLLVAYAIFVLCVSAILLLPMKLLRDSRKEK